MVGHASGQCTACSSTVVSSCRQQGWPFILEALKVRKSIPGLQLLVCLNRSYIVLIIQDPHHLERLSGLADLHRGMDAVDDCCGDDDEDI